MDDLCQTVAELARCDGILIIICCNCEHGSLQLGHVVAYHHGKTARERIIAITTTEAIVSPAD